MLVHSTVDLTPNMVRGLEWLPLALLAAHRFEGSRVDSAVRDEGRNGAVAAQARVDRQGLALGRLRPLIGVVRAAMSPRLDAVLPQPIATSRSDRCRL